MRSAEAEVAQVRRRREIGVVLVFAGLLAGPLAAAMAVPQTSSRPDAPPAPVGTPTTTGGSSQVGLPSIPSIEELQLRVAELEGRGGAGTETELDQYRTAISRLRQLTELETRIAAIDEEIRGTPEELERRRSLLGSIRGQPPPIDDALESARSDSTERLSVRVDEAKVAMDAARREVTARREESLRRTQQMREAAETLEGVRIRQARETGVLQAALTEDPAATRPSTILAIARARRTEAERRLLRLQPDLHAATTELAAVELEIALDRARMAEEAWRKWTRLLANRIEASVTGERSRAEAAIEGLGVDIEIVRRVAMRNRDLAIVSLGMLDAVEASTRRTPRRLERTGLIERLLTLEEQRLSLGGSREIGLRLRQELAGLGQMDLLRSELRTLQADLLEDYLLEIELGGEIGELQDPRGRAAELVAEAQAAPEDPGPVIDEVATLLERRRDALVRPLLSQLRQTISVRQEEARATERLLAVLEEYRLFIAEHLLSIRTGAALTPATILEVRSWQLPPSFERESSIGAQFAEAAAKRPALWFGGLLLAVALVLLHSRWTRLVRSSAEAVRRIATDRFSLSIAASIRTLLLAAPLPVLLWTVANGLKDPSAPDALMVFGSVFGLLVVPAFTACLLWACAIRGGLGEAHFRWDSSLTTRLRKACAILVLLVLPVYGASMAALVGFGDRTTTADEILGRIGFVLVGAAMTGLLLWIARPRALAETLRSSGNDRRSGRSGRARRRVLNSGLVLAGIAVALVATGLSWFGFSFATLQILILLYRTACLVICLHLLRELLERWLSASSRQIAFEQARRRRAEAAESRKSSTGSPPDVGETTDVAGLPESPMVDLEKVNQQAYSLVNGAYFAGVGIGLVAIWSQLLPAFGFIQSLVLWSSIAEVPDVDGGTITELVPISLFDVFAAVLAITLTVLLTRNIPGILQLLVLPKLPISAGVGYAVVSFTRYGIGVVGILVAVSLVGLRWTQIQWLASAAVLGLSFGLQEIFSNFVSGVLMLVEQPVRVGDVVTVNGVTGRVSRIQIRATTITDWDRHELVIPNKAFITGQFSNWTLSDTRTRQVIQIGVAYGSDYRLVERLLVEVAERDPDVSDDPAPSVVLQTFGESSVDFDLRVVVSDVAALPAPLHRIRLAIAEAFAEHGVQIPFPQRDLHLKSIADEASARLRPQS